MIEFEVEQDIVDGTRTLRRNGQVIGWIERGRDMTDLHSSWTEWAFTGVEPGTDHEVRRNIADAYEDARNYVRAREVA